MWLSGTAPARGIPNLARGIPNPRAPSNPNPALLASRPGGSLRLVTRRSALRASDLDRELVAERLRDAATEGRITHGELEDRLEVALAARTYAQLNSAMTDLPAAGRGDRLPVPLWARASLALAGAVGVLAAAAAAAMLFALIACLSAVWMVVSRAVLGREARLRRLERPRIRAMTTRQREPRAHVTGGNRRALLP